MLSETHIETRQSQIQEDVTFRVMHMLENNPDITQRELADRLGISLGRLNYCLKALMIRGWIKMQNFSHSKNKFGYIYLLTPDGVLQKAALTSGFLKRKLIEFEMLKKEIQSLSGVEVLNGNQNNNKIKN